ncbi:MAG: hypothetical protein KTR31_07260 [Myxococcales bacterium]|nr:hypothetical protein [Myxococcales bacterium]
MTGTDSLLATLGSEVIWLVLFLVFAGIATLPLLAVHIWRRRLPAVALAAGPGLASLAIVAFGRLSLGGWAQLDGPGLVRAVSTFGAVYLVGAITMVPLCLLTFGALAASSVRRQRSERTLPAVVAAVLVLLTAAVTIGGGVAESNAVYAVVRGVTYAVVGGLVAVALLGDADEAAAAAVGFPLLVAVGEGSERALAHALMVQQTPHVAAEKWTAAVDAMFEAVSGELWWSLATLLLAGCVALWGLRQSERQLHGVRGGLAALVWVGLAAVVFLGAELGAERLYDLVAACEGGR